MSHTGVSPHSSPARRAFGLLLVAGLAAPAGCGKRGAPLPPLPRGPLQPEQVTARQIGDRAVVALDVPEARGGKASQQPVRVELLRVAYSPGVEAQADPDAFRRRGQIVAQLDADPLVSGDRVSLEDPGVEQLGNGGSGWTLRYGVRVLDRKSRPSPLVVATDLVMVDPVDAVESLTAEPTADGMRLEWSPPRTAVDPVYNVYRAAAGEPWPEAPLNPEPLTAAAYLDDTVFTGESYVYAIRIVLETGLPYREGYPRRTREILAKDLFAPATPGGLVAVQEGQAVRLFWTPNPERDLDGYRIERSIDDGEWRQVGPPAIEQSSFLDGDVVPGQRLRYRIIALDRADPPNASAPTAPVGLELVREPATSGNDR